MNDVFTRASVKGASQRLSASWKLGDLLSVQFAVIVPAARVQQREVTASWSQSFSSNRTVRCENPFLVARSFPGLATIVTIIVESRIRALGSEQNKSFLHLGVIFMMV